MADLVKLQTDKLILAFAVPEPVQPAAQAKQPFRWTLAGMPAPFRRYLCVLALFTLGYSF